MPCTIGLPIFSANTFDGLLLSIAALAASRAPLTTFAAEDASDDPMHAGGLTPAPWISAEQAAMHVIDPADLDDTEYVGDENDAERADPFRDQFDGTPRDLTPEDETILGIDPYDEPAGA